MADTGGLNEPVQEGSDDATRDQKIAGLIRQVGADLSDRPREDLVPELRLRFSDAGIAVDEQELVAIADTITRRQ